MRRAERALLRRREMLAAYYEVLQDEGLPGASIAKIATRIDAPPSLLIHYFGTKEQMTIELVDHLLEEYRHGYGDRLASHRDPLARLCRDRRQALRVPSTTSSWTTARSTPAST